MRKQFPRLGNDCLVAVKRGVGLARRFSCSIMLGRHICNRLPLRLAVYAIKRLVTSISEFQKPISALLIRWSGERERRKQKQEQEKCSAMHGRNLTAFARSCEARRAR